MDRRELWSKYIADIDYYGRDYLAMLRNAKNLEDIQEILIEFKGFLKDKLKLVERGLKNEK